MKIGVYTDVHWSQNSSIVRGRGERYSLRLHNLIDSVNWAERCAWDHGCEAIICCGDFFDTAVLNSEEISALKDINWAPVSHVFLTGNHETALSSLEYSTNDIFRLCPHATAVSVPQNYMLENTDVEIAFLPYILERDRKTIQDYFGPCQGRRIIFSHNDIKDIQYGPFVSTEGFEVEDIHNNCELFINGHIHHSKAVTDKIIHPGNLTGQNFTEDAFRFEHLMIVIDTDTMHVDWFKNPHAFNFYKIDATICDSIHAVQHTLDSLDNNAVLTLKVRYALAAEVKELLAHYPIIHRVIVDYTDTSEEVETVETFEGVDHLKQFESFVYDQIGNSEIVKEELLAIINK